MQWDYYVNHFPNDTRAQQDTKYTWQTPSGDYYKGPNPPEGSKGLGILYPRAGTLGGCASHNALITVYPHDDDWTYIEKLTGDSSWSPRKMRKYFQKLEANEYLSPAHADGHGFNGWFGTNVIDPALIVKDSKISALANAMSVAINKKQKVGPIPTTEDALAKIMIADVNAPGQSNKEGLYQLPLAISGGTRSGPRSFVFDTATARYSNGTLKYSLDIWLNTYVTKVRFSLPTTPGEVPRAIGVNFLNGTGLFAATPKSVSGQPTGSGCVDATREVILSTGSYNTPQLLKLSGIGPKAELAKFGIPLLYDSPGVGSNLQDRYENVVVSKTNTSFEILNGCSLLTSDPDPVRYFPHLALLPLRSQSFAGMCLDLLALIWSSQDMSQSSRSIISDQNSC